MLDGRPQRTPTKQEGLGPLLVGLLIVLVLLAAAGALPGPVTWELAGH